MPDEAALKFVDVGDVPRVSEGVPRNGRDQPMVVPREGGKPITLTRTTTFIDCIDDKTALADYGERMVMLGIAEQPSILEALRGLDPENAADKRKIGALCERAKQLAGADEKRDKGSVLHSLSEYVDRGEPLPVEVWVDGKPHQVNEDHLLRMADYRMAMVDFEPEEMEQFVVVEALKVGGSYDRKLRYSGPGPNGLVFDNELFIGDLKTGKDVLQYSARKIATQEACYSRAAAYDWSKFPAPDRLRDEKAWNKWKTTVFPADEAAEAYGEPGGGVNQEWGIVIHAPSMGEGISLYWADLTRGWETAQMALEIRKMRSDKKLLYPFAA